MQKVTCEGCGHNGDPAQEAFFQMITGWRRMFPTTQAIRGRHAEQRFACRSCVDGFERAGMQWMQPSLFETPT